MSGAGTEAAPPGPRGAAQLMLELNRERIEHFRRRAATLGKTADDVVIVLLDYDDKLGRILCEHLMPGMDWNAVRAAGAPVGRGLAMRDGIQAVLNDRCPVAAEGLRKATTLAVVLVADDQAWVLEAGGTP